MRRCGTRRAALCAGGRGAQIPGGIGSRTGARCRDAVAAPRCCGTCLLGSPAPSAISAGLVFIYIVSTHWVFSHRVVRNRRTEFVAFASIGLVGLVLNSIVLSTATLLGASLPFAKAISAAVGFTANFVGRKALLFTKVRASPEGP